MALIGLQHIYNANFVAVILPPARNTFGPEYFFVCLAGMLLFFTGIVLATGAFVRAAGLLLGFALLAALAVGQLPGLAGPAAGVLASWTNPLKLLSLSGGAFVAAASRASRGRTFGRACLGIMCLVFGADHFVYGSFVASLVPGWIPAPHFWAYFCGAALLAAGATFLTGILARAAAALFAAMVLTWLVILHVPLALRSAYGPSGEQWTNAFEALAFGGIALMLAVASPAQAKAQE
jgi:uncharacterized membrane protein YphA (DoxX/SURF4 family)